MADGIVITRSHNPPEDAGIKYNPTNGGPADTDVTGWIQDRANELLRDNNSGVKRVPYSAAIKAAGTRQQDFVMPYVNDLRNVVDMASIRAAGLKLGVDPLGGAARLYWEPINATYGLNVEIVKIQRQFQLAFGNDPDSDRHGIVTPSVGLMNPNHYLAVAIQYLLTHREHWPAAAMVGKTLVAAA